MRERGFTVIYMSESHVSLCSHIYHKLSKVQAQGEEPGKIMRVLLIVNPCLGTGNSVMRFILNTVLVKLPSLLALYNQLMLSTARGAGCDRVHQVGPFLMLPKPRVVDQYGLNHLGPLDHVLLSCYGHRLKRGHPPYQRRSMADRRFTWRFEHH